MDAHGALYIFHLTLFQMFRKLNKKDPAAKVLKYIERDDEVLTQHAKKRVQRMMYYSVPLRPFVATIEIPSKKHGLHLSESNDMAIHPLARDASFHRGGADVSDNSVGASDSDSESSFMCTPKSSPPHAEQHGARTCKIDEVRGGRRVSRRGPTPRGRGPSEPQCSDEGHGEGAPGWEASCCV